MTASSGGLHEPADQLDAATIDRHRALASLIEELEPVDWCDQRTAVTDDEELEPSWRTTATRVEQQ